MNTRNLIIRIHELNTLFNYYSIHGSNIFFINYSIQSEVFVNRPGQQVYPHISMTVKVAHWGLGPST